MQERRLKEKFDMIPSLEELHALELEGYKLNVIVVDTHKDKKVTMLQQLALTLAKGLTSNPAAVIKKLGGLVRPTCLCSVSLYTQSKRLVVS